MSKAAQAFRTISEVAEDLIVPKHVLRFWELKFPQIKPMKRGGGRRYYRPEDVELLRGIRHLLHAEGYTIKGVQKILREQGVDTVKSAAEASAVLLASSKGERSAKQAGAGQGASQRPSRATATKATADRTGKGRGRGESPRGLGSKGEAGPVEMPPMVLKTVRSAISELEACRAMLVSAGRSKAPAAKPARRTRAATS